MYSWLSRCFTARRSSVEVLPGGPSKVGSCKFCFIHYSSHIVYKKFEAKISFWLFLKLLEKTQEFFPQVLKQFVNLSCCLLIHKVGSAFNANLICHIFRGLPPNLCAKFAEEHSNEASKLQNLGTYPS